MFVVEFFEALSMDDFDCVLERSATLIPVFVDSVSSDFVAACEVPLVLPLDAFAVVAPVLVLVVPPVVCALSSFVLFPIC